MVIDNSFCANLNNKVSNWFHDSEHPTRKAKVYATMVIVALVVIGLFAIHQFVGFNTVGSAIGHLFSTKTTLGICFISCISTGVVVIGSAYGFYRCRRITFEDIQVREVFMEYESP